MNLDDIRIPDIEKIALEARTTSRAVANVLVATNRFLKKKKDLNKVNFGLGCGELVIKDLSDEK